MAHITYDVTVKAPATKLTVTAKEKPVIKQVSTPGTIGPSGKSAYQVALDEGFVGTESDWIESLRGSSAYQVALDNGFIGTEEDWLDSLKVKASPSDTGKILTNDGSDSYWITIEDQLNGSIITWDLGEV